ncbi:MAG: DUF1292 domain-containing protein [Clostridiales bacterium]|nr:DUF1292 domain-containing protein [Clostridiales bacterium]
MKTRTTNRTTDSLRPDPRGVISRSRVAKDDVLAVIVDVDNGHEYYMAFIDSFSMNGRDYVVMYNYEPDDGNHQDPEIVIMRAEHHVTGEQYFKSIKNKTELADAFDFFYRRFEEAGG